MKPFRYAFFFLTLLVLSGGVGPDAISQNLESETLPPIISNVSRGYAFPNSSQSVTIQFSVKAQTFPIDSSSVKMCYTVDGAGPFCINAVKTSETTYSASRIPWQTSGAIVRYWVVASDSIGISTMSPPDTSVSMYFYRVLDREPTISDIQFTPNSDGVSGVVGAILTVDGTVTADTTDFHGAGDEGPFIVIQEGEGEWSGIRIPVGATDTALAELRRGDRITITGTVAEVEGTTMLTDVTVDSRQAGTDVPPAFLLRTSLLGMGTDPAAEEFESVLVAYWNAEVVRVTGDDEFIVANRFETWDTVYQTRVSLAHSNTGYTTGPATEGRELITVGMQFGVLQGIVGYGDSLYKLYPRDGADFKVGLGVRETSGAVGLPGIRAEHRVAESLLAFTSESGEPLRVTVELVDVNGRVVYAAVSDILIGGGNSYEIDLKGLSSGVYGWRVLSGERIASGFVEIVR